MSKSQITQVIAGTASFALLGASFFFMMFGTPNEAILCMSLSCCSGVLALACRPVGLVE
jgi:hypothetical protein